MRRPATRNSWGHLRVDYWQYRMGVFRISSNQLAAELVALALNVEGTLGLQGRHHHPSGCIMALLGWWGHGRRDCLIP
jgi:hypothetical protein